MQSSRSGAHSRALGSLVAALVAATLLLAPAAHAGVVRDTFFGMHDGRVGYGAHPAAPAGSLRLWDTGTTWRQIETRRDSQPRYWRWERLDLAVRTARENGAKPMIVLGQTPRFHAAQPGVPSAYGPGAGSMPRAMWTWKRYVRAVVARYGTTAEYQVWNEPNVVNYWSGTPAQMARLTKTAYRTAKAVDPGVKVISPSFPLRLPAQREWFSTFWGQRPGGTPVGRFVDAVGIHGYPLESQGPEASMSLLAHARWVLRTRGVRKPVWNLEINYGLRGGPTAQPISDALQAAYVARTYLLNAGAGVQRVYWYRWDLKSIANTILTRADNATPTRAGRAYARTHAWLAGTNVRGCTVDRRGVHTCRAWVSATQGRLFLWKPQGSGVQVRLPAGTTGQQALTGPLSPARRGDVITVGRSPRMVEHRR